MSHQPPKLPTWIFLVTNLALLAAAGFIAYNAHHPLTDTTTFSIVGCVVVAAIVGLVPIVAHYERRKNEMLDQRQRELEALGRTISTSAEQISIAANGFNEITDLAHRNLKHAEQLPHKLQEKIAEFNSLLENAREDEREEMEKELAELRSSESDRLQTVTSQIHKAIAELAKLETVAQKQLAARTELGEQLNQSVAKAQAEAARALNEASAAFVRQITEVQNKLLHELETKLAAHASTAAAQAVAPAAAVHPAPAAPATPTISNSSAPAEVHSNGSPAAHAEPVAEKHEPVSVETAPSAKRPKRIRKEEPLPAEAVATTPTVIEQAAPDPSVAAPPADVVSPKVETVTHISASPKPVVPEPPAEVLAADDAIAPVSEPPVKKRSAKKNGSAHSDSELSLGLTLDASPDAESTNQDSEVVERILTSDGATRLIATAYIGIGNRLFVRGSGPGLSWEKGVPLQFVSIGKWRWETSDAQAPVEIKLLKNDEVECSSLGTLKLDPGYQQEVTAKF